GEVRDDVDIPVRPGDGTRERDVRLARTQTNNRLSEESNGTTVLDQFAQWAIVERKDVVASGFLPPELLKLAELIGVSGCEIAGLGEIVARVVQPPHVLLVGRAREVNRDRLPSVAPDRAVSQGLPVLRVAPAGCLWCGEARSDAFAVHLLGGVDLQEVQQSWCDIDGVHELLPHSLRAFGGSLPAYDQGRAHTPQVNVLLVLAQGSIACHCPPLRVVCSAGQRAEIDPLFPLLRSGRAHTTVGSVRIDVSARAAFTTGIDVGEDYHDG